MYYIYKITNKINNKIYIGKHKTSNNESFDKYWGSGKLINQAIKKYGIENFTKEILEECNENNINDREIYWINKLNARLNNYNLSKGGAGGDSTTNTTVYNNGKNIIYVKNGMSVPEGYVKGSIPNYHGTEWRIKCSKSSKGKNKNIIPWNKGKNKSNNKVKLNSKNSKNTIVKQGILKGSNNPRAKIYLLIDREGNKYTVNGRLKQFCSEYNISINLVEKFVNKGPIILSKHNTHKEDITLNSVGWQVILDNSKNYVEEARNNRLKTYKYLYKNNLLTKRQNNINKILKIENL